MFLMKSRWPGASVGGAHVSGEPRRGADQRRGRHTNDGDIVLGGLELPESDIDGDTTLTLGLELVKNPRILEGALAELSGFLLSCVSQVLGAKSQIALRGLALLEGGVGGSVLEKFSLSAGFVCPSPALIREG
jgi:hypothetical protein